MQYIFLIYSEESKRPKVENPSDMEKMLAPWMSYGEAMQKAGVFVAGDALQPIATATTVSKPAGSSEPVFTDGPFAETKEQLGGYYLVDCKDLDEALGWAAKCPGAQYGKVEVRPVAVFD